MNPRIPLVALGVLAGLSVAPAVADPPFTPGNIIVSNSPFGAQTLFEFTPAGAMVRQIPVTPAGSGRDLVLDRQGRIQLYNGTFPVNLTQYDPATNAFSSQSFDGLSTINNLTYGGIGTIGRYVFLTDMATAGAGAPKGVVRFDLDGGPTTRFATALEPIDLTVGRDGLLYTLSTGTAINAGGNRVDVYHPDTLALIRTVTLTEEHRGIAVDTDGHIYTAQRDTVSRVNHYNPFGVRLDFINDPGIGGFGDIDINADGGLLIASHGGVVLLTTTDLDTIGFFQTQSSNGYNFAAWVVAPVPEPTGLLWGVLGAALWRLRRRGRRVKGLAVGGTPQNGQTAVIPCL